MNLCVRWTVQAEGEVCVVEKGTEEGFASTEEDVALSRLEGLEASLRERERQLEEAYRIACLGTWHWDKPTDVVMWSDEVYRAFGMEPGGAAPGFDVIREYHAPESRAKLEAAVGRALTTGEPYAHDIELQMPGGATRWIMARGEVAARDSNGEVTQLRGTIQDITERKVTEIALRSSQSRFQKLYDSDLIGIGFPVGDGKILDGNDALLRTIGYSREDMRSGLVRWDKMTPPEYREADLAHMAESAARGSCTAYEKEYFRKDGSRVPILCGFARLGEEREGSIGFIVDLSAQKAAEAAMREREHRFSALADSLPQFVWVADPDGNRTYTNQYYLDYVGMPFEKLAGAAWKDLLHPDDIERTLVQWKQSMKTGEPYLNEYRVRRHDGEYRSFLARGVPVRDAAGKIERWLGSATDIHGQKLAEEALRRTEKLAATGRLAASIAHEINNPLEAVTNTLYLALQDETLSAPTRMYLQMAEQELSRVAHVTTQTLQFHRQSVAAAETDLGELMETAYALFAPRFEASGVKVQREYERGQVLYCRSGEIRQVFANLMSNALDATRKGGRVTIRIGRARSWGDEGRDGIRVTIADTGHGIPAAIRRKIYEPFVSTKDDTGTGLGLWVSDGIVRQHGGRISLRSWTGDAVHGTVFRVFFPFDGIKDASVVVKGFQTAGLASGLPSGDGESSS